MIDVIIRPALSVEIPAIEAMITASARTLSRGHYDEQEIEAAVAYIFGVDSDLVDDGTYFVAEDADGAIVGCGGWSGRHTLFGGDRASGRDSSMLDPAIDAARIRAFFTAPDHARLGVASRLLAACEDAARDAGFLRTALMATLPGLPFYAAHGYRAGEAVDHDCGGTKVPFVPMSKTLLHK